MIPESEETECFDDIWNYYEAHKDELEDLDEHARKGRYAGIFAICSALQSHILIHIHG